MLLSLTLLAMVMKFRFLMGNVAVDTDGKDKQKKEILQKIAEVLDPLFHLYFVERLKFYSYEKPLTKNFY